MSRQGSKSRRFVRRILWALLAIILVAAGTILGISGYAASTLTQFERVPIQSTPAHFGLEYVDVSFASRDGLMLRGWWLETGDDNPVIVVVHGSEGNRAHPAERLKDASQNPDSKLWIVPEAQHGNSYLMRPVEYKERVVSFFGDALE